MCCECLYEVPVSPVMQSTGRVMDGGDCGYCCLAGILGVSIERAYEVVEMRMLEGWKSRQNMNVWRWKLLLRSFGLDDSEYRPEHNYYKTGAIPLPWDNLNWIDGVRDIIKVGCVLVVSIRFNGCVSPEPRKGRDTDHNVLITGYREECGVPGARRLERSIRVSCSVRGDWWIDWEGFLYWHGGYPGFVIDVSRMRELFIVV